MKKGFIPGAPLLPTQRLFAAAVRGLYFDSIALHTHDGRWAWPLDAHGVPTVLLVSHRNGAIDGFVVQKLHANAISMVSVQLTANPFTRLFFSGIPVLREKDRARYGESASALGNPIINAMRHVEAGGSLCVYPEGSSEWGPSHLPYHPGGAKIVRHLLQKGVRFEVRAVGLFYTAPDVFRSSVDVIVSEPLTLPAQENGESAKSWEARLFEELNAGLDRVSVHCQDVAHFAVVEQQARAACKSGQSSYGAAFLAAQQAPWPQGASQEAESCVVAAPSCALGEVPQKTEHADARYSGTQRSGAQQLPIQQPEAQPRARHQEEKPIPVAHSAWHLLGQLARHGFDMVAVAALVLLWWPVLLAGYMGGRFADSKNTVTFWRVMAAAPVLLLWACVLLTAACFQPLIICVLAALALCGLGRYASVRSHLSITRNS